MLLSFQGSKLTSAYECNREGRCCHLLSAIDALPALWVRLTCAHLQLCLCWVLAKRAHHSPQLLGGDGAITILQRSTPGSDCI